MKKAIITDLDGTLYYQKPVQICMAAEILCYYIIHFWKIKELKLVINYRKQHNNSTNFEFQSFCKTQNISRQVVEDLIQKWLISKPLKWIRLFSDKKLIAYLKEQKIPVVVYSDYPTEQKLKALNFTPTFQFYFDNKNIRFLKPNPQGLEYITKKLSLSQKDILVIGDRLDKDGLVASAFSAEYIILPQNPITRCQILEKVKYLCIK